MDPKEEKIIPVPGADGAPIAVENAPAIAPVPPEQKTPKPVSAKSYDASPPLGGGSGDLTHTITDEQEKEVVNLDEFTNIIKDRSGIVPEKPKEVVKPVVVPEVPKVEPLTLPEAKEDWVKDYGEAAAGYLKKSATDSREFFKARLKELQEKNTKIQELETKAKAGPEGMPGSYYEHPHAFILDPEYAKSTKQVIAIEGELTHWKQQFAKIRAGEKYQDIVNTPQGPMLVEKEPDANAELAVSEIISRGNNMIQQEQARQAQLAGVFKQNYQTKANNMKAIEDQYFPDMKDEKAMKPEAKKYYDTLKVLLKDNGLESNALAGIVSKLYAFSMQQTDYINGLNAAKDVETKLTEKARLAGPTSGDINNTNGKVIDPNKEVIDLSEFERMKG